MKNRFVSLLLAVVLLITAIPFVTGTVRAASDFKVSNECVEIIKKWEGFSAKPYWDYRQWTVGYGTRVPDGKLEEYNTNGISQEEATALLHDMLNDMGKEVNAFIDKFNLTMNQGQFDALLSLTFNCGGNWTREVSTLRTSIIEGWKGTDFLYAMGQWSTAGGVTMPALIRRRLAEANMYLNGVYDYAPPANYVYVRFDPNGGECETKTQGYDMSLESVEIRAVPTYEGYKFEGWYTSATGGEKVEKLDAGVRNYMLYAHWSAGEGSGMPNDTEETITGTAVNFQRQIATGVLSSFEKPVKGALVVDGYELGDVVTIVEQYTDSNGLKWGKISGNGGWINLEYTCEPVEDEADDGTGVQIKVTANDVNLRRGPGTGYALVGKANSGDKLTITKTETGSGYTWGKSSKGWICLKYTNYDKVVNSNSGSNDNTGDNNADNKDNSAAATVKKGTVKVNDGLRIRSGAGTGNAVLGYLSNGTRVEILEEKTVDGMLWGRISKGWISMDYVKLDSSESDEDPEQTPEAEEKPAKVTGRVTLSSGRLNVRSGPSTGYGVVTSLTNGTAVEILEQKTVGATVWGRISKGWISLDYVKLDAVQEEKPAEPQQPTEPAEPTEPTQPEQPAEPTEPSEPTQPEEPTEPSEPTQPAEPDNTTPAQKLTGKVVLTSGMLRVRSGAGINYSIVTNLANGTKVEILETKMNGSTKWGRIASGWISLDYVKLDSEETEKPAEKITGTVNAGGDSLRIRTSPSMSSAIAGYLADGTKVEILETKTVGGTKWGRIASGWICMDYVKTDGQSDNADNGSTQNKTGKVIADCLRIRSGAGTGNKIVGLLYTGEKVTILEEKTVDGVVWGRITKGWISLDYIKF